MMIEKIFGSPAYIKVLLYMYSLPKNKKVNTGMIVQATGLSYATLKGVLSNLAKAKIIVLTGATKSRLISVAQTKSRKILWKFIKDINNIY